MFRLPGTPESRMTYEELCRHAEETGNLTAMAMAEYVNELLTEQDIQTPCDHAEEIGTLRTDNQRLEGLLQRVQVAMSLDDTEWGYSGTEKYTLLADIKAALSTANGEMTE